MFTAFSWWGIIWCMNATVLLVATSCTSSKNNNDGSKSQASKKRTRWREGKDKGKKTACEEVRKEYTIMMWCERPY